MADKKNFIRRKNPFPVRVVYQPIFDLGKRSVIGYEALARINKQPYFPEDLFRRTYSEGQIVDFDVICLGNAFKILPKMNKKTLLFVNIEPITLGTLFRKGEVIENLFRGIRRYRGRIVFELTEGMKIRDFEYVKRGVSFLRRNGSAFALDDVVGIGSKLFSLASLKPDYIKVGRELIHGIADDSLHQNLFHRIQEVAARSKSKLIAEGIERKRDLLWLYHQGITCIQGFYLARPNSRLTKKFCGI
ncbi:MAG: EAL domain-containing protein [Candidatus Omnitrophica bacterium]|nr:EAL domain-containing protein [Candidatus Omnitrophota bacterium]